MLLNVHTGDVNVRVLKQAKDMEKTKFMTTKNRQPKELKRRAHDSPRSKLKFIKSYINYRKRTI